MTTTDEAQDKVLVTGATGFTGGHLAKRLRADGVAVRALVRDASRAAELAHIGVELVEGDIRDAADVSGAAEGCRIVYHIAALFRTAGHPDSLYREVNVGGTANVIEAARRHGVARVVHCSTIGVHGDVLVVPCPEDGPFNPGDIYQETKLEAELLAREAFERDVEGVVVRPAGIYGPGDMRFLKLFRTIQKRTFRMFGSGETLWHPVHVEDLVDGILLAGRHPAAAGRVYILGADGYVTLNELVRLVAAALGVAPPRGRLPLAPLMLAARLCEAVCTPLGIDPPLHRRRADFFVKNRAFTTARAKAELGFAPRVALADGLVETAAWYRGQGLLG